MVVVIARKVVGDRTELMAVPITTQPPRRAADGFEVPPRVKAHLGLDAQRCWIMVTELNRFLWPGPDVRPIRRGKELTPFYGALPEKLFRPVLDAVIKRAEAGVLKAAKRGE